MNPTQFRNWQTFAIRMAHRGWPDLPRRSRNRVAGIVKDFFRRLKNFDCDGTLLERISDWDETAPCKHDLERRSGKGEPFGMCYDIPGDLVQLMEESWNPYFWSENKDKRDRWDLRWLSRVRCCLRAGLDLAGEPSNGVLGFEICDLRRMYQGNIPAWINNQWADPERQFVNLNQGECAVVIWL